jgi:hypothetical protein
MSLQRRFKDHFFSTSSLSHNRLQTAKHIPDPGILTEQLPTIAISYETMSSDLYRLTATEVSAKIKAGETSVEEYAKSLLARIEARDEAVQAWAYLDPEYVIKQAKALDAVPQAERGPLHGIAIAVKDVIYTKGELPELPSRLISLIL